MNTRFAILPVAIAFAFVSGSALADTPIHQTRSVAKDATINISNVSGRITVTAWARASVEITGSLGEGSGGLQVDGDAHQLTIKVKGPKDASHGWFNWSSNASMSPTDLDVHVPVGATLNLHAVSASTSVSGMHGGDIDINSVSGRVDVEADVPSIHVQGVSGHVRLDGHFGKADLQTVSGDISASKLEGSATVQTVSGDVGVEGGPFDSFSGSSVSGDMGVSGGVTADGHMDVDSMSGDVNVTLPAQPVSVHASTFSGDINSDIGTVQHREHGPGASLDATSGKGGGSVKVKTFSGDVRIQHGSGNAD